MGMCCSLYLYLNINMEGYKIDVVLKFIFFQVVGNANALMQSDDWDALITDAKERKCFMGMDSIPTELLVLKGSASTPKVSWNNMRSSRSGGRQRHLEMLPEPKSGTPSEDEEKANTHIHSKEW